MVYMTLYVKRGRERGERWSDEGVRSEEEKMGRGREGQRN